MRKLFATLIATTAFVAGSFAGARADSAPVQIDAILPLTGSGAFIGVKKVQTLDMIADEVNRTGGIRGRPIKFVVHDDASSPEVGVQLTAALVASHATVILGSVLAGICNAAEPIVARAGPLVYCYSPNIYPPDGSYMFTATLGMADTITKMFQYFNAHGLKRVALISSTDASGEDFDRPFTAAFAKRTDGLELVSHERFNVNDLSVAAQVARIKAADPQVVMVQAIGPAFGTVLRNLNDAGLHVPTFGAAGNLSYKQLEGYRGFTHEVYFVTAGGASAIASAAPQQRRAQAVFFAALKAANIKPEYLYADTWDPPMLIVDALRHVGPDATAAQVRAYIDGLSTWWGVSGHYDFRLRPQRGLGYDAAIVDRWTAADGEIVTLP